MHAFLCVHGRPLINGERIREFIHRPQFEKGCYVWQNRELTLEEHEKVARKVIEENNDLRPYSRIVADKPVPAPNPPVEDPRDVKIAELTAALAGKTEEVATLRRALTSPPRAPGE
jgi:hypothetical protein